VHEMVDFPLFSVLHNFSFHTVTNTHPHLPQQKENEVYFSLPSLSPPPVRSTRTLLHELLKFIELHDLRKRQIICEKNYSLFTGSAKTIDINNSNETACHANFSHCYHCVHAINIPHTKQTRKTKPNSTTDKNGI